MPTNPQEKRPQKKAALRRTHPGTLLIDALLSVAIFGAIVAAFSSGIMQGQLGTVTGSDHIRATYLADEGLQAVRWIRNQENILGENTGFDQIFGYATKINHGVKLVNGAWVIQIATPTTVDGLFTRSIRFTPGNNNNERIVQSTVNWTGTKGERTITVTSILTNWQEDPPPPPPDWSQPIVKSFFTDTLFDEPSLNKVAISGDYLFIAASEDFTNGYGLFIVNISNLSNPLLVNSINLGGVDAYDVVLRGQYAYLSTNDATGEISIVNIANPAAATCCAGTINLPGTTRANGLAITGTGLYITREQSTVAAEFYIYDLGDSPTAPTLVTSYETDPSSETLNAVATTGSLLAPYAYLASGTTNDEELRVVSTTGSNLTGNGSAGSNMEGTAVALYATGAYVGAKGNDACELFSFNIAGKVQNPNATPACGGNQSYDLSGTADPKEEIYDMAIEYGNTMEFPHLFMGLDARHGGVNVLWHLQIVNVGNVRDINSTSKRVYDGNITEPYGVGHGLAYRLSDHTLFMVGGAAWDTSDILILQPTYEY